MSLAPFPTSSLYRDDLRVGVESVQVFAVLRCSACFLCIFAQESRGPFKGEMHICAS
jgi:hypothetical protein